MYEISSTSFNSTALSANKRRLQRLRPSGGSEQARAVIFAFWAPLYFFGAPGRSFSLRAASKPCSVYLCRTWRIVLRAMLKASIIWVSVFPASASINIRDRVIFRAFSSPLFIMCFSVCRSLGFNLTRFLFCMDTTSFKGSIS